MDSIEILTELLAERVGSTISVNALAEDLHKDKKTVKKWLNSLENLFIVFRVNPYSKNISKAIKKSGKYYFYDTAKVRGDESKKPENLVALSLKKEIDFLILRGLKPEKIQLVKNIKHEFTSTDGVKLRSCLSYLENLDFQKVKDQ